MFIIKDKTIKIKGRVRTLPSGKKVRVKPHERGGVGGNKPLYRKRCRDCGKMFNAKHTYETRCPQCENAFLRDFSRLGA